MKSLLKTDGNWYKGNLHTHTTLSDGKLTPDEAIRLYRSAGYDFLALTDHWKQSKGGMQDGLLLLSGAEWDVGDMLDYPVFHLIGAGMEKSVKLERASDMPPQTVIDAITQAGGMAILAHPAWSVTNPSDCLGLRGLAGAEIYNSVSGFPWNCRPDSSLYFDIWAAQGKLIRCMAADDTHFYKGEQTKSYLMVNAPALTLQAIKGAILAGDFYASQGPRFVSIVRDGSVIHVEATDDASAEVETIVFYSNTVWCDDRVATCGVRKATYRIKPTDRYLRIELIGKDGRRAWSSPYDVVADSET